MSNIDWNRYKLTAAVDAIQNIKIDEGGFIEWGSIEKVDAVVEVYVEDTETGDKIRVSCDTLVDEEIYKAVAEAIEQKESSAASS
ncbi:hypothetical protein [Paenibacillus glucanolyticus]|uniref:hypothetical protein n=1 Tax=Paenibacillus glucanolyticus TaxID=59843 RepID=UPI0009701F9D|nr:hypothetical protein [Paenibacillus glucanolyticus]OMF76736.1 hypothetical protein BK142_14545 [Paenibacillus glucanolyticus]